MLTNSVLMHYLVECPSLWLNHLSLPSTSLSPSHFLPSLPQRDYCFDYVLVRVFYTANSSLFSEYVLLPTVKEDGTVSLIVEPGVKKDTHFTARIYFNLYVPLLTHTNICERSTAYSIRIQLYVFSS